MEKVALKFSDKDLMVLATALAAATQMFVKFPRLSTILDYRVTEDDLAGLHKSVKEQLEHLDFPKK